MGLGYDDVDIAIMMEQAARQQKSEQQQNPTAIQQAWLNQKNAPPGGYTKVYEVLISDLLAELVEMQHKIDRLESDAKKSLLES